MTFDDGISRGFYTVLKLEPSRSYSGIFRLIHRAPDPLGADYTIDLRAWLIFLCTLHTICCSIVQSIQSYRDLLSYRSYRFTPF